MMDASAPQSETRREEPRIARVGTFDRYIGLAFITSGSFLALVGVAAILRFAMMIWQLGPSLWGTFGYRDLAIGALNCSDHFAAGVLLATSGFLLRRAYRRWAIIVLGLAALSAFSARYAVP